MNQLAEYLYTIRATRLEMVTKSPTAAEAMTLAEHARYLEKLKEDGTAILYGRTQNNDETTFGIVIFRASSEKEAREIMENDPAVRGGLMRAELFPYRVVLMGEI